MRCIAFQELKACITGEEITETARTAFKRDFGRKYGSCRRYHKRHNPLERGRGFRNCRKRSLRGRRKGRAIVLVNFDY